MRSIARREFLRVGTLAAGSLAIPGGLAACSKGSTTPGGSSTSLAKIRSIDDIGKRLAASGAKPNLSVFLGGEDYVGGTTDYVGFGLVGRSGTPLSGADAKIWLAATADPAAQVAPVGPMPAPWYGYRKPDPGPTTPKGINAAEIQFDQPGIWQMLVQADSSEGLIFGTAAIQVKTASETKLTSQKAIPSQTPTLENHRGVEPICTREPPCDMHKVTLAKALTLGKPTCFIVATPKFCMSRTCGPNLEELIAVEKEVGGRATFIHAEVYRSNRSEDIASQVVSPTFKEWGFQSEPWLFVIDKSGRIHKRFEGAATATIMKPALMQVL